jgi:hypothetical protein
MRYHEAITDAVCARINTRGEVLVWLRLSGMQLLGGGPFVCRNKNIILFVGDKALLYGEPVKLRIITAVCAS